MELFNVLVAKGEKTVRHIKCVMKVRADKVKAHYSPTHTVTVSLSQDPDIFTEGPCKGKTFGKFREEIRYSTPK